MAIFSPAAVLWDMDGTIVDTEPAWLRAERDLLREWGSDIQPEDETAWVGIGLWDLAHLFQERGVRLHADDIVADLSRRVNAEVFEGELDWRPGARELLASLTAAGIPNVLVTMSTREQAEQVAARLPEGTFAGIISGNDVAKPKPDPEPYTRGASLVGVEARDCVAIEDSVTGARSAFTAGAVTVGVPNLVDLRSAPCDRILSSLEGVTAHHINEIFSAVRA